MASGMPSSVSLWWLHVYLTRYLKCLFLIITPWLHCVYLTWLAEIPQVALFDDYTLIALCIPNLVSWCTIKCLFLMTALWLHCVYLTWLAEVPQVCLSDDCTLIALCILNLVSWDSCLFLMIAPWLHWWPAGILFFTVTAPSLRIVEPAGIPQVPLWSAFFCFWWLQTDCALCIT